MPMKETNVSYCSCLGEESIMEKAPRTAMYSCALVSSWRAWISLRRALQWQNLMILGLLFMCSPWRRGLGGQLTQHGLPRGLHLLREHPCQPFQRAHHNKMAWEWGIFPLPLALDSFQSPRLMLLSAIDGKYTWETHGIFLWDTMTPSIAHSLLS